MKLINPKSKKAYVNLLADFILNKLGLFSKTIIQVNLFDNFFIVEGVTDSDLELDFEEIKNEFFIKHSDLYDELNLIPTIGSLSLIKKNKDFFKNNCYRNYLEFYDTQRPLYHKNLLDYSFKNNYYSVEWKKGYFFEIPHNSLLPIENFTFSPLTTFSEFPYGYSLNLGRSLIYYSEYIVFNIFNSIGSNHLKLMVTNQKDAGGDQIIELKSQSPFPQQKIKSIILDNFDFNIENFNNKFLNYDFADEILNVKNEKPWLIKNVQVNDLVIL
jgi:hypothetical protein